MTDERIKQAAAEQKKDNEKAGQLAGAGAGVIAGAQVGTVLLPIPVVGTFTGALVGGMLGTRIGKKVGGAILDKVSTVVSEPAPPTNGAAKPDLTKELERLAQLKASGAIDEEEFKAAKAKLLGL